MHGVITPLPTTPSWRGAQLRKSTRTNLLLLLRKVNRCSDFVTHVVVHNSVVPQIVLNI
jgi:hypothetical protein